MYLSYFGTSVVFYSIFYNILPWDLIKNNEQWQHIISRFLKDYTTEGNLT